MSDKVLIPPPHVLTGNCGAGFARYRMAFTSIRIDPARDDGRRITVVEDGHTIVFDLDRNQAAALAALLDPARPVGKDKRPRLGRRDAALLGKKRWINLPEIKRGRAK